MEKEIQRQNGCQGLECGSVCFDEAEKFKYLVIVITDSYILYLVNW